MPDSFISLVIAENTEASVAPIFILDPWFVNNGKVGKNRWKFLQQSLTDLDNSLNKLGSRYVTIHSNISFSIRLDLE